MASANVDFPRSFGPYRTFRPGPNSMSDSRIAAKSVDTQPADLHRPRPTGPRGSAAACTGAPARESRAISRPRRRVFDHAVEPRDRVLDHRREIVGKDAAGTRLQSKVRAVDQQDAGASVRRVGSLKVAEDPLDLAFLRQGHGHVEVQPDDMAIEVRRGQQRAQLVACRGTARRSIARSRRAPLRRAGAIRAGTARRARRCRHPARRSSSALGRPG